MCQEERRSPRYLNTAQNSGRVTATDGGGNDGGERWVTGPWITMGSKKTSRHLGTYPRRRTCQDWSGSWRDVDDDVRGSFPTLRGRSPSIIAQREEMVIRWVRGSSRGSPMKAPTNQMVMICVKSATVNIPERSLHCGTSCLCLRIRCSSTRLHHHSGGEPRDRERKLTEEEKKVTFEVG